MKSSTSRESRESTPLRMGSPERVRRRLNFSPSPSNSHSSSSSSHSHLSKEEIEEILSSPVETGYTYSKSAAYRRTNSSEYEHPRMCRRIPTAPPEFEHDPAQYRHMQDAEYRRLIATSRHQYQLSEFGPLSPAPKQMAPLRYFHHGWEWLRNGGSGGTAENSQQWGDYFDPTKWASWVFTSIVYLFVAVLYLIQVGLVFTAAVGYYGGTKLYRGVLASCRWLFYYFVVMPTVGPYLLAARKARLLYQACSYAYPSLSHFLARMWEKVAGSEEDQSHYAYDVAVPGDEQLQTPFPPNAQFHHRSHASGSHSINLRSSHSRNGAQQPPAAAAMTNAKPLNTPVRPHTGPDHNHAGLWAASMSLAELLLPRPVFWFFNSIKRVAFWVLGVEEPVGLRTRSHIPHAPGYYDYYYEQLDKLEHHRRRPSRITTVFFSIMRVLFRLILLPFICGIAIRRYLVNTIRSKFLPFQQSANTSASPETRNLRGILKKPRGQATDQQSPYSSIISSLGDRVNAYLRWILSGSAFAAVYHQLRSYFFYPAAAGGFKRIGKGQWTWAQAMWTFLILLPLLLIILYASSHAWLALKDHGSGTGENRLPPSGGPWDAAKCEYSASPNGRFMEGKESATTRVARKVACRGDRLFGVVKRGVGTICSPILGYPAAMASGIDSWWHEDPKYHSGEVLTAEELFSLKGPTAKLSNFISATRSTIHRFYLIVVEQLTSLWHLVSNRIPHQLWSGVKWTGGQLSHYALLPTKWSITSARRAAEWSRMQLGGIYNGLSSSTTSVATRIVAAATRLFNGCWECVNALVDLVFNTVRAALAWLWAHSWVPLYEWANREPEIPDPRAYLAPAEQLAKERRGQEVGIESLSQLPANHPLLKQISSMVEAALLAERTAMEKKLKLAMAEKAHASEKERTHLVMERQQEAMKRGVDEKISQLMVSINTQLAEQNSRLSQELRELRVTYIQQQQEQKQGKPAGVSTPTNDDAYMEQVRQLIKEYIHRYDADKTGLPDYALESSGGAVVTIRCTKQYEERSRTQMVFGIPLWYSSYSPRSVIQRRGQGTSAGECWAFEGAHGYLTIRLAKLINVTAVSYEHLPVQLSPDGHIRTAPKRFLVWSYQNVDDLNSKFLLGNFTYNDKGEPLQMFKVQHHDPQLSPVIELETLSNYGAPVTCLYRFRVHGSLPHPSSSSSLLDGEAEDEQRQQQRLMAREREMDEL